MKRAPLLVFNKEVADYEQVIFKSYYEQRIVKRVDMFVCLFVCVYVCLYESIVENRILSISHYVRSPNIM